MTNQNEFEIIYTGHDDEDIYYQFNEKKFRIRKYDNIWCNICNIPHSGDMTVGKIKRKSTAQVEYTVV